MDRPRGMMPQNPTTPIPVSAPEPQTAPQRPKKPPVRRWVPAFLSALRIGGNVSKAAQLAGVDRTTVYNRREKYESFAKEWDEALEASIDELEIRARTKALEGSERMMIFMLKSLRPAIYRDRYQVDAKVEGQVDVGVSEALLAKLQRLAEGPDGE